MQDNTKPVPPLDIYSDQVQRTEWLKTHGLDQKFTLLNVDELLLLRKVCNDQVILKAQLDQSIEDSRRLDIFEILFYTRKIFAIKNRNQLNWGFKIDEKEFFPFPNIRTMIDAAVKNIEEVNKKLEEQGG